MVSLYHREQVELVETMTPCEQHRPFTRRALLACGVALVAVACSSGDQSSGTLAAPTTTEQRPAFAFIRDGAELMVEVEPGVVEMVWELDDDSLGRGLLVESIEPVSAQQVFVGVCCEPADGRQVLVDIATGSVEIFPLTVRFPSVGEDANSVVSGGSSIVADNLGLFLAYENGVGVVERGSTVRAESDGVIFQPRILANDRVAYTFTDDLIVANFNGETIVQATVEQVVAIDYDERNNVIVALADDDVVLLLPDTLDEVFRWPATRELSTVDVRDGWLILTRVDGAIDVAPIDDPDALTTVVDAGATAATWLR